MEIMSMMTGVIRLRMIEVVNRVKRYIACSIGYLGYKLTRNQMASRVSCDENQDKRLFETLDHILML